MVKLWHGDCMELMRNIPDKFINLIINDIPYNIKKAEWDKIDNYIEWCGQWILGCQRVLKDNGSFYFFHNDIMQLKDIMAWIEKNTNFIFKQFIVWNKKFKGSKNEGYLQGYIESGLNRNYQKFAEYILFYTFQDETGLTKIMGNCVYPIRDYIRNEILRAKGKINLKQINNILGTADSGGGIASAVLSLDNTVPAFITKKHYLKLKEWLNNDCNNEYLKKEYEDLRYTFNNQKTHHSIWNYEISEKIGHITPKPTKLLENIILHSSNENDIILDCFMGSGSTMEACLNTNRNGIGIEKEKKYYDIALERIEAVKQTQFKKFM